MTKRPLLKDTDPDAFAAITEWAEGVKRSRGRPRYGKQARQPVTMRLDPDTLERWRATGPGWQTRLSAAIDKLPVQ